MSSAPGIPSILDVLSLANNLRKKFQNGPSQFKDVSERTERLSKILQRIQDQELKKGLADESKNCLNDSLPSCLNILEDVSRHTEKYHEITNGPKDMKKKFKGIWQRLRFDEGEITRLAQKINDVTGELSLCLTYDHSCESHKTSTVLAMTKEGVEKLQENHDEGELQDIMDWLSPINSAAKQADVSKFRKGGTGKWFLETNEFQKWFNQNENTDVDERTLHCYGAQGAGKTILMSKVIDEIRHKSLEDDMIGLAFFYCHYRDTTITTEKILSSFLKQLLLKKPTPEIISLCRAHKRSGTHLSTKEARNMLKSVISSFSKVFIVIDALDECRIRMEEQQKLFRKFFLLQQDLSLGVLVSSRRKPDIVEIFKKKLSLKISARDADIKKLLESRTKVLPRCVQQNPELQREIFCTITKAADGMFLLARLYLNFIEEKMSEKEVRTRLKNLPPGLDEAYKETVERIQNQAPGEVEKARKVLTWICFSRRPMTPREIQHAVAVEFGESKFDETNITGLDDLVSICAGLVAVDEKTDRIRLEHYTTQEYFEKNHLELFPDAQYQITATCLSYLSSDAVQKEFIPRCDDKFRSRSRFPLSFYAGRYWGDHAREVYPETKELIEKFFQNKNALSYSMKITCDSKIGSTRPLPINLAVFFCLDEYIIDTLKQKIDEDNHNSLCEWLGDDDGGALFVAASHSQTSTASILLQNGWKVNTTDKFGNTALYVAAYWGQINMIQLLVEHGADIEQRDSSGRTPLLNIVHRGSIDGVKELLRLRAKIHVVDNRNSNVIHNAAMRANEEVMKLLLSESQCDTSALNFCDVDNMTPLLWAVNKGAQGVTDLLITHGVDVNAGIEREMTPLLWAVNEEAQRVVDLLLTHGVDVNAGIERKRYKRQHFENNRVIFMPVEIRQVSPPVANNNGLTPLHFAALKGNHMMTKFLLSRGATVNVRDRNGDTPLHLTLRRSILDPFNPISDYKDKWSALDQWSVEKNAMIFWRHGEKHDELEAMIKQHREERMALLEVLMEEDEINVDIRNAKQESPLHLIHYDEEDSGDIFCKIITKSQSIFTANDKGQTPLHLSCLKGNIETTRMMLDMDSCVIEACDLKGQTPFFYAARTQNDSMIEMFTDYLEKRSPRQWIQTDLQGRTPFQCYLESGLCLTKIVELFLEKGTDINIIDKNGNCPLSIFLQPQRHSLPRNYDSRVAICKLLLERGTDINRKNYYGENLGHASMHEANPHILGILKDYGVDMTAKDSRSRNILHHGAMYGFVNEETMHVVQENLDLLMNQEDIYGMTPLSYAENYANRECYETFPFFKPPDRKLTLKVLRKAQSGLERGRHQV